MGFQKISEINVPDYSVVKIQLNGIVINIIRFLNIDLPRHNYIFFVIFVLFTGIFRTK